MSMNVPCFWMGQLKSNQVVRQVHLRQRVLPRQEKPDRNLQRKLRYSLVLLVMKRYPFILLFRPRPKKGIGNWTQEFFQLLKRSRESMVFHKYIIMVVSFHVIQVGTYADRIVCECVCVCFVFCCC